MTELPSKAQAVIIGGGVIGCWVAYHLVKIGSRDVLLLRAQAAHLRHDLARGRPGDAVARHAPDDRARQVHG